MKRASLFLLIAAEATVAAADPLFAITRSRIDGPKGAIRHTQVIFLPQAAAPQDCQALLESTRNIPRRSTIEGQECAMSLPSDLGPVGKALPVESAYSIIYRDRFPLLPDLKVADLYDYAFDPGSPEAVCQRALSHYRQRDEQAICLPPRGR